MLTTSPAKMIVRPTQLRPISTFVLPFAQAKTAIQTRCFIIGRVKRIPPKIPFCPDVKTFLTLIGRNLSQHADKIPTWRGLFGLRGEQMRKMGIEPPRTRRYLLRKLQQYRQGQYGVGGDLKYVEDGKAEVRVVQVPIVVHKQNPTATLSPGMKRWVVNVPPGVDVESAPKEQLVRIRSVHIRGADTVAGSHYTPIKGGGGAKIAVTEGLWEDRRGRKIDGGERRAAETRVSYFEVMCFLPLLIGDIGETQSRGETNFKVVRPKSNNLTYGVCKNISSGAVGVAGSVGGGTRRAAGSICPYSIQLREDGARIRLHQNCNMTFELLHIFGTWHCTAHHPTARIFWTIYFSSKEQFQELRHFNGDYWELLKD